MATMMLLRTITTTMDMIMAGGEMSMMGVMGIELMMTGTMIIGALGQLLHTFRSPPHIM